MTPKEKAKELVSKFVSIDNDIFCSVNYPYSKQCALIAVDEILKEYAVLQIETSFCYQKYLYWEQVKTEIEKL